MGSRAVIVLCRDEGVARRRFGIASDDAGAIYTRTGRPFFGDVSRQRAILDRLRAAVDRSDLWQKLDTNWMCLDAEIMPWSAKAQELLKAQYATTGTAARHALDAAVDALSHASARDVGSSDLLAKIRARADCVPRFVDAYRRYCWAVDEISDLEIAPFHLLATERGVHVNKDHEWHMRTLAELCRADEDLLKATAYRI